MIKKKIMALATGLMMSAAIVHADGHVGAMPTGYLQLGFDSSTFDYPGNGWDESYDPWRGISFATAVGIDLDAGRSLTIEASTFSNSTGDEQYYGTRGTLAAAHMNWSFGAGSAGVFGGILATNDYYDVENGSDFNTVLGAEASTMLADVVMLDGEVAVINQINGYYEMGTVTNVSFGAQYFPQDNMMLEARAGYLTGQLGDDEGEDVAATSWSVGAAFKPEASPVSIFAAISGLNDADWWGDDADGVRTASVGLRWSFDGASLKAQSMQVNRVADLSAVSWLRNDGDW